MPDRQSIGPENAAGRWLDDPVHRAFLAADARRQLDFFRPSLRRDGGFDVLAWDGSPLPDTAQELHTTTRLVHSYAIGKAFGDRGADRIIDAGMTFLWSHHRDTRHGGYLWSVGRGGPGDGVMHGGHVPLAGYEAVKGGGRQDVAQLEATKADVPRSSSEVYDAVVAGLEPHGR